SRNSSCPSCFGGSFIPSLPRGGVESHHLPEGGGTLTAVCSWMGPRVSGPTVRALTRRAHPIVAAAKGARAPEPNGQPNSHYWRNYGHRNLERNKRRHVSKPADDDRSHRADHRLLRHRRLCHLSSRHRLALLRGNAMGHNCATDGTTHIAAEYLEVSATR